MNAKSKNGDQTSGDAVAQDTATSPQPAPTESRSLQEIIACARRGDTSVLPELQRALQEHPEIWQTSGNLAAQAQGAILKLIARSNLFLAETAARFAAAQREELAGPQAGPLEKLLVERIVATHLLVSFFESEVGQQEGAEVSQQYREYLHARLDQATRRLLDAMTALARIRKLLPQLIKVEVAVSGEVTTKIEKSRSRTRPKAVPGPARSRNPAGTAGHNRIMDYVDADSRM